MRIVYTRSFTLQQVLYAVLLYFNKRCGLRTSGVQFIFWLLLGLFSMPKYRMYAVQLRLYSSSNHDFISFVIFYCLVWIMIVLNCFADKEQMEFKYPRTTVRIPYRKLVFEKLDSIPKIIIIPNFRIQAPSRHPVF